MQQHLKLLGFKVKDRVTGFIGVVESISYDLYGCVQAYVKGEIDKKKPGEAPGGHWFDDKRLDKVSKSPVMAVPSFGTVIGPADKPSHPSQASR